MKALPGDKRRSAMVLAVTMLAALFTLPSAVAQDGGVTAKAAKRAPIERFLLIGTDPRENANPVLLGFGPIHAKGVDRAVSNRKDIFRFPDGSLIVRHRHLARHQHRDSATCLSTFSERGTYRVVGGTGDYVGARGHGHYVLHGKFVACRGQRKPDAFVLQIRAHGPLRL